MPSKTREMSKFAFEAFNNLWLRGSAFQIHAVKKIAFYIAGVQKEKVEHTKTTEFPSTIPKWGVLFYFEESNRSIFPAAE